ncbi:PEP-CTERM sorting domain-containing protein [Niveibacterium sp.]|uniref:PEP-CTERM sorting domain-containing protein n=1 Tax=Niveibacterium sp. TaxID=2017444 RepID=UPI0035B1E35E
MFHLTPRLLVLGMTLIAPSAFAQYTFVDGTLTVKQNSDMYGFLYVIGTNTEAHAGSATARTTIHDDSSDWDLPVLSQPLTSVASSGNSLASVQATNSGFDLARHVSTGYFRVSIQNLEFDLAHATVFADIYTREGAYLHQLLLVPHGIYSATLGTPDEISNTVGADGYFHATGGFTDLRLTTDWDTNDANLDHGSRGIISRGLGFNATSSVALMLGNTEFAEVSFDARFAVPEPSTYALFACGLICLGIAARRKPQSDAT